MAKIFPCGKTLFKALEELRNQYPETTTSLGGIFINGLRIKFFLSKTIDSEKDGSKNGTEVHGIGLFSFHKKEVMDINIFLFLNFKNKEIEYVIIPKHTLLERMKNSSRNSKDEIQIRFWLTSFRNHQVMETHGIGAEFEFMGLWIDKSRDYSHFHNNWTLINSATEA